MDFLVELITSLPPDMDEGQRQDLLAREAARGRQLKESGQLVSIWRFPGRLANVGIWSATDAESLHDSLSSLPLWPWMDVTVRVLARHPLTDLPAHTEC